MQRDRDMQRYRDMERDRDMQRDRDKSYSLNPESRGQDTVEWHRQQRMFNPQLDQETMEPYTGRDTPDMQVDLPFKRLPSKGRGRDRRTKDYTQELPPRHVGRSDFSDWHRRECDPQPSEIPPITFPTRENYSHENPEQMHYSAHELWGLQSGGDWKQDSEQSLECGSRQSPMEFEVHSPQHQVSMESQVQESQLFKDSQRFMLIEEKGERRLMPIPINITPRDSRQATENPRQMQTRDGDRQGKVCRESQQCEPQSYPYKPVHDQPRASRQNSESCQQMPCRGDWRSEVPRESRQDEPECYIPIEPRHYLPIPINVATRVAREASVNPRTLYSRGERQSEVSRESQVGEPQCQMQMPINALRVEECGNSSKFQATSSQKPLPQPSCGRRLSSAEKKAIKEWKKMKEWTDEPVEADPRDDPYEMYIEMNGRVISGIPYYKRMPPRYSSEYGQQQDSSQSQGSENNPQMRAARPREARNEEVLTQAMHQLSLKNSNRTFIENHGSNGIDIDLTANYLRMHVQPNRGMYEYDTYFEPPVDSKAIRFRILKKMEHILGTTRTFDGALLYLPFKLTDEVIHFETTQPHSGDAVNVYVTFRRQRSMGECTHFYNILMFRIMNELKLARLGRQYFDPHGAKIIPQQKLEVWPGYVTKADEYEGGLMLMCDAAHRVLRQQTALEVIYDITRTQVSHCETEVKNMLAGCTVLTRYNNRLYRVDDVSFERSPMDTFNRNGVEITFVEYYKQQYGLDIMVLNQPVLLSRREYRTCRTVGAQQDCQQFLVLIPELCYMTGLTESMLKDHGAMKEIATYTQLTPNQRHYAIKQFLNGIEKCASAKQLLDNWGLTMDQDTIELHGRILKGEDLHFGSGAQLVVSNRGEWKRTVMDLQMLEIKDLLQWGVIFPKQSGRYADDFITTLLRITPAMGMVVNEPQHVLKLDNDRIDTYLRALQFMESKKLQLVVIIFPTRQTDRYTAVKQFCNVQAGMASQVVQTYTLNNRRNLRSMVQMIALQINCKIGGSLWTVLNPFKTVMVIGIDVYHDMVNRRRSAVGFVSSLNQNLTQYFSQVIYQEGRQELIDGLRECFLQSIQHYYNANTCLPSRIIVYRDGVSDGQMQTVVGYEVEQFIKCFPSFNMEENYNPKFTVVLVMKRINTKIFAVKPQNELENPPPGTVVDHTITDKFLYDFILVSQFVNHGTINPTHYAVLYDNSDIKPDYVQRFSYKLCHMYFNWPGIIRVPAPCQYAHRLAFHAGTVLKTYFHPNLAERLFYL